MAIPVLMKKERLSKASKKPKKLGQLSSMPGRHRTATRYLPMAGGFFYALGMLAYEALTGTHAFRGPNGEILRFHQVLKS